MTAPMVGALFINALPSILRRARGDRVPLMFILTSRMRETDSVTNALGDRVPPDVVLTSRMRGTDSVINALAAFDSTARQGRSRSTTLSRRLRLRNQQ